MIGQEALACGIKMGIIDRIRAACRRKLSTNMQASALPYCLPLARRYMKAVWCRQVQDVPLKRHLSGRAVMKVGKRKGNNE